MARGPDTPSRTPAARARHRAAGGDILVQIVAKNTRDLHRITMAILAIDGVTRTSTAISLHEAIPYRPHALLRVAADTDRSGSASPRW